MHGERAERGAAAARGERGAADSGAAGERVRLFVALELPEPVRNALVSWRGAVLDEARSLRPVARGSLHVTLCFLGWRWAHEIPAISAAVAGVGDLGRARLSVTRGLWLPPRRPRVLAVELADAGGALGRVQGELSQALEDGGWYEPEARPFLAHVTVARVGRGGRVRRGELELPPAPALEFEGSTVTLYRSRLARGGAQYEPLARFEL